jgi:hypothetical protein
MHEFTEHGKVDVPWWACFNETCAESYAMKARNRAEILLPTITIVNNDRCPCLRKGCACGFKRTPISSGLNYHETMLREMRKPQRRKDNDSGPRSRSGNIPKRNESGDKRSPGIGGKYSQNPWDDQRNTSSTNRHYRRHKRKEEKAIIDNGADVNYLNQEWCDKEKIRYEISGYGKIKNLRWVLRAGLCS